MNHNPATKHDFGRPTSRSRVVHLSHLMVILGLLLTSLQVSLTAAPASATLFNWPSGWTNPAGGAQWQDWNFNVCGYATIDGHSAAHLGNDSQGYKSGPVLSIGQGVVKRVINAAPPGNGLMVEYQSTAGPFTLLYQHVNPGVPVGATVSPGTQVGTVANWPSTSNNHVHVSLIPGPYTSTTSWYGYRDCVTGAGSGGGHVNPIPWLTANGPAGIGNPFGSVDSAGSSGPGYVNVAGWALDPNAPTSAIGVHVYVGGPAGAAGAEGHAVTANTYRPDVPKVYPGVGDYHGYDYKFATDKVGTQPVYVYALNAGGTPGSNQLIASRTVTIKDPSPFGSFDQVTSPAPARVNVAGWDVDPNVPTSAIAVHVYVGGPSGAAGAEGHAVMANDYRPDVPKVYPGVGNYHGLNVTFDTTKSGAVPVYFYGINRDGTPGHNVLLGSKTVTIAPVALTVSVKPTYGSTRLKVNVGPDWASGNYSFQLQKLVDGAWSTVGTYLTSGTLDTKTVNPTKGVYRVVLPQQRNATTGVTSTSVRITS